MTFDESFEQALRSAEPVNELRSLVMNLFSQGHAKETILELFEQARQRLRQSGRERDEDFLLGGRYRREGRDRAAHRRNERERLQEVAAKYVWAIRQRDAAAANPKAAACGVGGEGHQG